MRRHVREWAPNVIHPPNVKPPHPLSPQPTCPPPPPRPPNHSSGPANPRSGTITRSARRHPLPRPALAGVGGEEEGMMSLPVRVTGELHHRQPEMQMLIQPETQV